MKPIYYPLVISLLINLSSSIAQEIDKLPIKGFCIAAPSPQQLDKFNTFIEKELSPRGVNTLILRVEYNYEFKSHPELRSDNFLTESDVKKIVSICKKNNIQIIPQINLLGHQSWHSSLGKLLEVYPEFDETPHIELPEKYIWPNDDGLYCKSYCPLHPKVHNIIFELVDEICDVFEANAFHAGMDEVFYIGNEKCLRCGGRDKAELFAGEVTNVRNHLVSKNRELWIWGDRLIDGKTTGLGMWEASMNNTYRAIDMIPNDVFICDWHYERPDHAAVYFAMKGFRVATCPWRNSSVAVKQIENMYKYREHSSKEMKENFCGIIQTVWSGTEPFFNEFYNEEKSNNDKKLSTSECFKDIFKEIQKHEKY